MADKTIDQLPAIGTPGDNTVAEVQDPAATPQSRKMTLGNLVSKGLALLSKVCFTSTAGALSVQASAADGTTQVTIDTNAAKTTGDLLHVNNNGSPLLSLSAYGELTMNNVYIAGPLDGSYNEVQIGSNGAKFVDFFTDASYAYIQLGTVSRINRINPTAADGTTPFTFNTTVVHATGDLLDILHDNVSQFKVGAAATAGQTNLYLWDPDNSTLQQVTLGVANSGGLGFRVLRLPNAP